MGELNLSPFGAVPRIREGAAEEFGGRCRGCWVRMRTRRRTRLRMGYVGEGTQEDAAEDEYVDEDAGEDPAVDGDVDAMHQGAWPLQARRHSDWSQNII